MKIMNTIELRCEGIEKCHTVCHVDCPIGSIYDYACALKSFCINKMQEAEEAQKNQKVEEIKKEA